MEGRDLSAMTKRVAETTNAFLKLTDDMNIKRNDVMTSGVNINPKYRYENKTAGEFLMATVFQDQFRLI